MFEEAQLYFPVRTADDGSVSVDLATDRALQVPADARAYGAGILNPYGEIEEFRGAEVRPLASTERRPWVLRTASPPRQGTRHIRFLAP